MTQVATTDRRPAAAAVDATPVAQPSVFDSGAWPKSDSGAVDWDAVFESPNMGILWWIDAADSPKALREIAALVLRKIFTRKDDDAELGRLIGQLYALIGDDMPSHQLADATRNVKDMLREIKEFRKRKAVECEHGTAKTSKAVAKPAAAAATRVSADRRRAAKQKPNLKTVRARKKRNGLLLWSAVGGGVVAAAVTGALLWPRTLAPESLEKLLVQQMRAAATGSAPSRHVFGGSLRARRVFGEISVSAEDVPVLACVWSAAALAREGRLSVNGEVPDAGSQRSMHAACEKSNQPVRLTWVPTR